MVLCVSDILWSPAGITEDGLPIEPHPELEVTDGWYRLRAQVDLPMARAVRKGTIRIGRKIGVAGAKVCVLVFLESISQRNKSAYLPFFLLICIAVNREERSL